MLKKMFKVTMIVVLLGFSFFYTEKVTKIVRKKDPIMIEINKIKDDKYIQSIGPIINEDEYIVGINGCEVDINKSYNKMKSVGKFKEELIVMKQVKDNDNLDNKYIISGNKMNKNISIIFILNNDINEDIIEYLNSKKITINYFVDKNYLEKNTMMIKFLSKYNNIYYYGDNGIYEDKYIIYANNLIGINSNNESSYCLTDKKDEKLLKLCTSYQMKTIKTDYIKNDLYNNVKEKLSNGSIITINSNDLNNVKASINYIVSRGYNIVTLDNLFNENKKCN